jgi:biopolymer transport protein ExbD
MFGQKKSKGETKQAEVDLNRVVTPMLDMTFQILFFLIMNFHLPSPEGQVDLILPAEDSGAPSQAPTDLLDKTDNEYRLRLICGGQGEGQGNIASMTWRLKSDKKADPIAEMKPAENNEQQDYFKSLDSKLYGLYLRLREIEPKEGGTQPSIRIECDKRLRYSELLRVMDVARKMKFTNVGVMPIPKDGE